MYCVSTSCQFFAQLRTNDSTAAVGWVDCNTDIHALVVGLQRPGRPRRTLQLRGDNLQLWSAKISEAGDPRYRLPLSQLDSPFERGSSEAEEYMLTSKF